VKIPGSSDAWGGSLMVRLLHVKQEPEGQGAEDRMGVWEPSPKLPAHSSAVRRARRIVAGECVGNGVTANYEPLLKLQNAEGHEVEQSSLHGFAGELQTAGRPAFALCATAWHAITATTTEGEKEGRGQPPSSRPSRHPLPTTPPHGGCRDGRERGSGLRRAREDRELTVCEEPQRKRLPQLRS
jgi:hypothetical protein